MLNGFQSTSSDLPCRSDCLSQQALSFGGHDPELLFDNAVFGKGIKCDLIALATEMKEESKSDMTVYGLKSLITSSQAYEEEFVKTLLEIIISTRKEQELKLQVEATKKETELKLQMERKMEFELEK
ncbi:hypothetical protein HNY73_003331 [Argiope bruennichi]|uniref:Uncharacterized protein n=1 Tax=Argiope bruennichi TaxID=94029 RepID=A0A8T0FWK0_ARGBR|nr:hypothetical protein HNY73_003331 [Argiope bruennichi]